MYYDHRSMHTGQVPEDLRKLILWRNQRGQKKNIPIIRDDSKLWPVVRTKLEQ